MQKNSNLSQVSSVHEAPVESLLFERSVLALVICFVVCLISMAWFNPLETATASPRSLVSKAEPLILSGGLLPGPVSSELLDLNKEKQEITDLKVYASSSAKKLHNTFGRIGYQLDRVLSGNQKVPRVFLTSLPNDLSMVPQNKLRKDIFFQALLPLILQVNEEILVERRRLWKLHFQTGLNKKISAGDRLWLRVMAERYKVKQGDIEALFNRVDIVPTSLALAQAAEESGWGTSRFAKEGNAMFGQWARPTSRGLVPLRREKGKNHKVQIFDTLIDSVRAYTLNLNTHRAYEGFRSARQTIRRSGRDINGRHLAGKLLKYSERGEDYVIALRNLIDHNGLAPLDGARLDTGNTSSAI